MKNDINIHGKFTKKYNPILASSPSLFLPKPRF